MRCLRYCYSATLFMRNEFTLILILLFLVFPTYGQKKYIIGGKENSKITSRVISNDFDDGFIERLAYKITRNSRSEKEQLAAIYLWITTNIEYDHELAMSTQLQNRIYTSEENVVSEVLKRKKALCGGYSFLLRDLCAKVGIRAEVVHGYTKSYSGIDRRTKPHHTWNVVNITGQWELLDITWAIGHGQSDNPDSFWFLTSPEEFINSHYPEDKKWTLLENPISLTEFQKSIGE